MVYFFATLLFILVYMGAIRAGFNAIGINIAFYQCLLFTVVLIVSRMFNIVPANIGISEVICGSISKAVDISFGSGIIISGIIRIINYAIYGLVTLATYISSLIKSEKATH